MAVKSAQAGAAFGCVRAGKVAVKSGSGAWEVAGHLEMAGVALEARAGPKSPIRWISRSTVPLLHGPPATRPRPPARQCRGLRRWRAAVPLVAQVQQVDTTPCEGADEDGC